MSNVESNEAAVPDAMTSDELAESKDYGRRQLYCTLIDLALDVAFLVVFLAWIAHPLGEQLATVTWLQNYWLRIAAFFVAAMLLQLVIAFPLSIYSGFILEHQFGLSRQSLFRWLWRYALRHSLSLAFGLVLVVGLYAVIWLTGSYWWLAGAAAAFGVSVVLGQLVPVLILPLFYKIERLEDQSLAERFERLAEGTGLEIEGVYRMQLSRETVKANAMLAGLGRTRRVILGDTLLDEFTPEEIEVVLAHEVGHHVYRHITKFLVAGLIASVGSFWLCDWALQVYTSRLGVPLDYGNLPVSSLAVIMLVVSLFSTLLGPLQNAVSRHFERQCDQYALDRTGLHAAYVAAFSKLAKLNKADPDPHPLEVLFFHDHPPIAERLAMAEA